MKKKHTKKRTAGEGQPNYGTRKGQPNYGTRKRVLRVDSRGGQIIFERLGDAAKSARISRGHLWRILNKDDKSGRRAAGYQWGYVK